MPEGLNCMFVRQPNARVLGHAALCAQQVVEDELFAVLLADDVARCGVPILDLVQAYAQRWWKNLPLASSPRGRP